MIELSKLVQDLAEAVRRADHRKPRAVSWRGTRTYQAGIGPHSESETLRLVLDELVKMDSTYAANASDVTYPGSSRQRCDLCLGTEPDWTWVIEAKLLRLLGDNGKPNDNMLTHVLSPYPGHRSALTDCSKLAASSFPGRKAVVIIGYDYDHWPLELALEAFETLAQQRVRLGIRANASFSELIHPVHQRGIVTAWEILQAT